MTHTSPDTSSKSALLAWIKEIAEVIAANAAAPAETLRVLMDHDHKAVSIAVARNPATPVALLKTLSGSLDADVARVAKSKLVQRDRIGSRADL